MRCLALAALLALALPASAQTHLADSTGGYVALRHLSFGSGNGNISLSGDVTVGWRRAGGLDYGLLVGADRDGLSDSRFGASSKAFWVGPTAGYTWALGRGVLGRVEGTALYQTSDYSTSAEVNVYDLDDVGGGPIGTVDGRTIQSRRLAANVTATVARPVRLAGSVRLHPTLGGFVGAGAPLRYEDSAYPGWSSSAGASAGVHVGLPLSFRLFGQDVAVASQVQIPLTEGLRGFTGPYAGGGLRLNF